MIRHVLWPQMMRKPIAFMSMFLFFGIFSCAKLSKEQTSSGVVLPSCNGSNPVFTVLPVPVSTISDATPLGSMTTPYHTIPTDHVYLYLNTTGVSVSAPVNGTITAVTKVRYVSSPTRQALRLALTRRPLGRTRQTLKTTFGKNTILFFFREEFVGNEKVYAQLAVDNHKD